MSMALNRAAGMNISILHKARRPTEEKPLGEVLPVTAGGGTGIAVPIFTIFIVARIAHSIVYLRAMQPWRTIAFAASLLAIFALMAAVLHLLLTA